MEKATCILNMASAVILLVTGVYVQVVFSAYLSPVVQVCLGLAVGAYLVVRAREALRSRVWRTR